MTDDPAPPAAPYYAEVFAPRPALCFRYVRDGFRSGSPMPCPEPARWIGAFRDRAGRLHRGVTACDGHCGPLLDRHPYGRHNGNRG